MSTWIPLPEKSVGLTSPFPDICVRALSSAWTEHLASDQDVAGSNPAAPIILRDGQHLADGSTTFIKEPLLSRFDFITLRDGGRRYHAIRQHLIDSMGT